MKKSFKSFILIILIMILTLIPLGVRCSSTEYADEYKKIKWYSNEPNFEFYVYEDKSNILGNIETMRVMTGAASRLLEKKLQQAR